MEFLELALRNDLTLLFVILTLGALVGKAKLGGVELSAAGGVLFIAMAFGNGGYILPDDIASFGFAFFIYAIGFGAGPRFFQTFRKNGLQFGAVAVFVAVIASAVAFACALLFELPYMLLPGIIAGALTSTSTLAAAYELAKDPLLSVGYGISYPFGLIGLLLLIQFLPRWLGIDLKAEAQQVKGDAIEEEDVDPTYQRRVYDVWNIGLVAIPLRELKLRQIAGIGIVSIHRGESIELATADSILKLHDRVLAEGRLKDLLNLEEYIGPEIVDSRFDGDVQSSERVVINRKGIFGRSLQQLALASRYGILVTRLQRGGIELPVSPDLVVERGDIVTITGQEAKVALATTLLGRREYKIYETDIFTFSAGLLLGILVGMIKWPIINASLGNSGGLLFVGIVLGYLRNFGPFSGRVPVAARFILQELGLLLFLAGIGTKAGQGLIEHVLSSGAEIFITGALITTITLFTTLWFCHRVLRFDWNTSFGATTGGVTSTVALRIVTREADSQYAVLGYAGVYAFANILLTLLGQFIVRLI